jgi:two-component system response regulator AtoC
MREAVELARRAARARSTVLITGETGTGKEVIAGFLHARSPRSAGPFVKVNCAALPETLLESELFGHERGAFTGADLRRVGRFEQASGGTLLLDEIAELSLATQAKLLRVLQDQEFHRLGGTTLLRTDARILAATNRDLAEGLADGSFRADLYYRLDVISVHLPPLRERREDVLPLAEHFREHFARELDRPVRGFTADACRRIETHGWPGNVRELRNAVERAVLMCEVGLIGAHDLALSDVAPGEIEGGFQLRLPPDGIALEEIERLAIEEALRRCGYVQKDAARLLRVTRRQLNYAIRRMGLTHPSWRRNRADDPAAGR